MRRLYIGGLSHSVTQKDLKDRFGKFGDVEDVELRTRRDNEGIPLKTFAYININISDDNLKKCLTVLNKSKWKGGTLQIEAAKESFLHKLAEERQAAAQQRLQQPAVEDKRQKILDSLSRAGEDNFNMKAAVPGTEVPGHKDWVVSKFGRVLPVLQLRCQKGGRARTMKYDPSKYSHNIRKLDRSAEDGPTPVTQLTWELQGGDDDISKKRRGEFPPYEPPRPKKTRKDVANASVTVSKTRFNEALDSANHAEVTNGYKQPVSRRLTQRRWALAGSDIDSDEEIRRMVAAQDASHGAPRQEADEDNLEVVGLDFLVTSSCSRQQKGGPDDEEDCDSADTDELLASRKPAPLLQERLAPPPSECISGNGTDRKRKTKKKSKAGEEEDDSADEDHSSTQRRGDKQGKSEKMTVLPVVKSPPSESDGDDEDEGEEESESAADSSDSDYEAMFSNVTHLEISLADLQRIAEESQQASNTTAPSILGSTSEKGTNLASSSAGTPAPKKGTTPEEILAALMEEDSSEDEWKKKKKKRKVVTSTPLPAFRGTMVLSEGSEEEGRGSEVKKQTLDSEVPQLAQRVMDQKHSRSLSLQKNTEKEKSSESSEEEEEENNMAASRVFKVVPAKSAVNIEKAETSSSSTSDDAAKVSETPSSSASSTEEDDEEQQLISAKNGETCAPAPESESSSSEEEEEEEEEKQTHPRRPLRPEEEEERQRKANMRRLAAVQQRQREAEEHKKLIQGALSKLDAPTAGAGKHIVFGSDDEEEEHERTTSEVATPKKTLFEEESSGDEAPANEKGPIKEKVTQSAPQLFDGSEDEEDGDEEDGSRFDIRPQFEGRAGQKLMELQSRFGTDERFRMDSRFLEEDEDKEEEESERKRGVTEEDEALEGERKKNLSILQSVLGGSQQTCSTKTTSKAKTFRDVSALHYDPSREEHTAFETKATETKESKSARRKKREEAQKLPEVSKEIYYDVSGDLKAVFGQTKEDDAGVEEKTSWDQEEEERGGKEEQPTLLSSLPSAGPSAEKEEPSAFKFSFFGDNTETGTTETEYKVESIQAPKVSWQQDLRFHDSSSEEDEEEVAKDEEQSSVATKAKEEEASFQKELFFFFPDDSRLTDGPRLFCRSSHLEEQREQWEERRSTLRQEYRKKHKDARRKLKASQKS